MIDTLINLLRKWQDWLEQAWLVIFVIVDFWIVGFITFLLGREFAYEMVG